jgi:hypothetical protein
MGDFTDDLDAMRLLEGLRQARHTLVRSRELHDTAGELLTHNRYAMSALGTLDNRRSLLEARVEELASHLAAAMLDGDGVLPTSDVMDLQVRLRQLVEAERWLLQDVLLTDVGAGE